MKELSGWVLDVYDDPQDGIVLWLAGADGQRWMLWQSFPVRFFAAGPNEQLRALWRWLLQQPINVKLAREERTELFEGPITVLAVTVPLGAEQPRLFRRVYDQFPDLTYYDTDIPIYLRYAAVTGVYPLARVNILADDDLNIHKLHVLASRWELDDEAPGLREMIITPGGEYHAGEPANLRISTKEESYTLALEPAPRFLAALRSLMKRFDPDILVSNSGDTWILPKILEMEKEHGICVGLNRDESRPPREYKAFSYHAYGQVMHRGRQVMLYGRWHLDNLNMMAFGDLRVAGVCEQARVTGLPVQVTARRSPGAGITNMQIRTALKKGILVPYQKQQAEYDKDLVELMRADRGGMIYQPLIGLHEHVAEIDFVSMYPSIMVEYNVSPETVLPEPAPGLEKVPELELYIRKDFKGLIPETLGPLVHKRIRFKEMMKKLWKYDPRQAEYKARASGLKWLSVVTYGYLGYKNARYGRIEAHQTVNAYSRDLLLRAKEIAEERGYRVIQMYIDCLWVQKEGVTTEEQLQPLLDEIREETRIPIMSDGIYRWVVFTGSKLDARIPVPNRYFGVFQDGETKARGIAVRRHDTPLFVQDVQQEMLEIMAEAESAAELWKLAPKLTELLQGYVEKLRKGAIPAERLLVVQRLSRELDDYKVQSPAARAAAQLRAAGKQMSAGQRVPFIFTRGRMGVHAWELPTPPDLSMVDVRYYAELLLRAALEVMAIPYQVSMEDLRVWVLGNAGFLAPPGSPPALGYNLPMDIYQRRFPVPVRAAGWG